VSKHWKKSTKTAKKISRLTLNTALVVTAILAIAAVTVVSRQRVRATGTGDPERSLQTTKKSDSLKIGAQNMKVDRQTGQMKELTPDEAQKLAGGLKELVNQSTEGLVEVRHADGSVSVDLQDRFQNVTVARVNKDGSVAQSCVDNPKAAGAFFGIDPKLIDPTVDTGGRKTDVSPARTNN
jgi:hypothetical protein